MAIPNKQIGWSQESNLLWEILAKLQRLVGVIAKVKPYKVYTAFLTQSGTNDPIATVIENTLGGTPIWTRNSAGNYTATLTSAFPSGKTFVSYTHDGCNGNTGFPGAVRKDDNTVWLTFNDGIANVGQYIDIGSDAVESIEIRVYS